MQSSSEIKNVISAISTSQSTRISAVIFAMLLSLIENSMCSLVYMRSIGSVSRRFWEMKNIKPRTQKSEWWSTSFADTTAKLTLNSKWRTCKWMPKILEIKVRTNHSSPVFLIFSLSLSVSRVVFQPTCRCKMSYNLMLWCPRVKPSNSSVFGTRHSTRLTRYSSVSVSSVGLSWLTWLIVMWKVMVRKVNLDSEETLQLKSSRITSGTLSDFLLQ